MVEANFNVNVKAVASLYEDCETFKFTSFSEGSLYDSIVPRAFEYH
jgi:hypothetical protein